MSETVKSFPRSPGTFDQFAQEHAVNLEFVTPIVMSEYKRVLLAYVSELRDYYDMSPEDIHRDLGHTALGQIDTSQAVTD